MKTIQVSARIKTNNHTKPRAIRAGLGAGFSNIGSLPADKEAQAVKKYVAEADGEFGIGSVVGDIWWEVVDAPIIGSNQTKNGFMAEKHKGETLMLVTLDEKPPSLPVVAVLVDMYPEGKRVVITSDFDMGDWIVVANGRTFVPPADG